MFAVADHSSVEFGLRTLQEVPVYQDRGLPEWVGVGWDAGW